MSIIYIMIPLALVLVGLALWALIWAIRSGQMDDLESQGWSVVLDDDQQPRSETRADTSASAQPAAVSGPENAADQLPARETTPGKPPADTSS